MEYNRIGVRTKDYYGIQNDVGHLLAVRIENGFRSNEARQGTSPMVPPWARLWAPIAHLCAGALNGIKGGRTEPGSPTHFPRLFIVSNASCLTSDNQKADWKVYKKNCVSKDGKSS